MGVNETERRKPRLTEALGTRSRAPSPLRNTRYKGSNHGFRAERALRMWWRRRARVVGIARLHDHIVGAGQRAWLRGRQMVGRQGGLLKAVPVITYRR